VLSVSRLTAAGALDPSYGSSGSTAITVPADNVAGMWPMLVGDRATIVAGGLDVIDGDATLPQSAVVARLNSDGSPDLSIGPDGVGVFSGPGFGGVAVNDAQVDDTGRVLVSGRSPQRGTVARLSTPAQAASGLYRPLAPARLMDTRHGTGGVVGPSARDSRSTCR